ncbi:MAG TPA: hypothetical protein ENN40_09060 [Candidatus Aminicenantes bacterium]|nr:hypothetical protein [Candidatus Aminicenantes bacterium]
MVEFLLSAFWVVLTVTAAVGYASVFFKRHGIGALEFAIISSALGLGTIALLTLGAAALRLLSPVAFAIVLSLGNLLFFFAAKSLHFLRRPLPGFHPGLLLLPFFAASLFYCFFPPTFYDSMMYHLAVPNLYLMKGGLVPWVTNFNASLPLNGEMLSLFSLLGGGLYMPKLISLAAGVLIALLLISWCKKSFSRKNAFLSALAFVSIPQVGFLMASSKPDMVGMLFLLAGCRLYFLYAENSKKPSHLLLSGVLCGLAAGTKYIFAFYLAAFFLALLGLGKDSFANRLRAVVVMGIMTFLLMTPWFVKNLVHMGNPVYPYLNNVFQNKNWTGDQSRLFATVISRGKNKPISEYLCFPFRVFFHPYSYGMTAVWGLMFLFLLPLAFFQNRNRTGRILLVTGGLAYLFLLFFAMVPRYFLPVFLLLALPVARGADTIQNRLPLIRRLFTPLVILTALYNLVFTVSLQDRHFRAIPFVRSALAGEFKGKKVNYLYALPYFAGVEYMNRNLEDTDKVLFLGEERTFYLEKDFLACSFADRHPLLDILRKSTDFNDFFRGVRSLGVTHIFFTESGLERMGKLSRLYSLDNQNQRKLRSYLGRYPVLYRDVRYTLYKVRRDGY